MQFMSVLVNHGRSMLNSHLMWDGAIIYKAGSIKCLSTSVQPCFFNHTMVDMAAKILEDYTPENKYLNTCQLYKHLANS